jgi:translation initiation factor IF-3
MRIHRHRRRTPKHQIPDFRTNGKIDVPEVRVIDDEGVMQGVMPTQKAIELAQEKGLDLIEVSPKAQPPVCKIIEYSNFKYQKEKEAKKQRAQSKAVEVKGVRLSLKIGKNDLDVRLNQAKKFLEKGNKVRIEMILRGREKAHADRGRELINRFIELVGEEYEVKVESPVKAMHGRMNTTIARIK